MLSLFGSLFRNRRLLKDFIVRDLKARYVGSSMGFFWSVVFPIINLFVYMFVFRLVLKARWSDFQGPLEVALVMLAGIVVWAAYAETISRATNSLVENSNLIQKVVFPSEVLPVYLTISSLINMAIGLPVVLGCVLWFAFVSPTAATVTVPGIGPEEWQDAQALLANPDLEQALEGNEELAKQVAAYRHAEIAKEGADPFAVRVVLMRGVRNDVTIPITFEGTATRGEDWDTAEDQVVIPSGCLEGRVFIHVARDGVEEEAEELIVKLGEPTGGKLGSQNVLVLKLQDSPGPAVEMGELTPVELKLQDPDGPPYYPLNMGISVVCLPLLFLLQVLFTVGISYFLATFNLFMRDTYHLVGVGITVWMFATPIFYPGAMVESAGYGWILMINPMHWLIENYRMVLLYGLWPDWELVIRLGIVGVIALFLGSRFFMAQKQRFPDLL